MPGDEEETVLEYPEGADQSLKDYIDALNALAISLCGKKAAANIVLAQMGIPFLYSMEGC